jgi:hypothetical protein
MLAKMDATQLKMDKLVESQQKITMAKAEITPMLAKMGAMIRSGQEEMIKAITEACLEKKESTPEETEAVGEPSEVPEGATGEETIGAIEDRSRDLRLAAGCHGKLKTHTKHDGGSRQECAAAVRRPTHHTVPAMCKGHVRKGPGKKCHRSGIRGRGKTSGNGMRGMIRKRHQRLEGKKMHCEATRQRVSLENTRLLVKSSIGLQELSDWTLWKCRPPLKRKT